MKNLSSIAIKELKSNKKMTFITIIGIIIVTILINSITTLTLSYQDYIVNLSRNKENWEAAFDNIEYNNIQYIENDSNVKEVSIIQDIGISENSFSNGVTELVHIKAYDKNALKNMKIDLKKGRLPQEANEIIINDNMSEEIGEEITATIDGIDLTYTIVGEIEKTDFDEADYTSLKVVNGAITLCDREKINDSQNVSAFIISNNISDIYNTTEKIEKEINSKNQELGDIGVKYNEELLAYACVAQEGSEFQNSIRIVVGLLIGIISISSIALIYTIYNISMSEKKKYIASLSSIGANKKQIFLIYFIEGIIITLIAIPIGLLISFGIDNLLINVFDNLFKSIQGNILNTTLEPSKEVSLKLVYSGFTVIASIVLVTIIVLISIFAPIMNASKTTIIELMRKTKYDKVGKSSKKTPKFILKIFKAPGDLAYKNLKRSRYKFITMIISLTTSIVLFISITGYIENLEKNNKLKNLDYNYSLSIYRSNDEYKDYSKEIIDTLKSFGLVDSIYGKISSNPLYLFIEDDKINDSLKKASQKSGLISKIGEGEKGHKYLMCYVINYDDEYYSEYLKQIGMEEPLKDNECILINYSNVSTKYYDELYLTNYKEGDLLKFDTNNIYSDMIKELTESMGVNFASNKEVELKVGKVTDIIPKGCTQDRSGANLNLIVNKKTMKDLLYKTVKLDIDIRYDYRINSSYPDKLDEMVNSLDKKYNEYDGMTRVWGTNYSVEQKSNENEKLIKEILLYSFLVLICILSIINVFNIMVSNITLRRNEFAELKAIGMSKKQINKMLRLEGAFYGGISLIIGFIIGIAILYVLYTKMLDINLYKFSISLPIFVLTAIVVFAIIFISIFYAKKQINRENISDIIKEKI